MEANADLEELERHYRRIRSLFQQLQVGLSPIMSGRSQALTLTRPTRI